MVITVRCDGNYIISDESKFTYCSAINKIGFAGLFSRSKDTASFNNVLTFYRSDKHKLI